jgi:hypothetical protein
MAPVPLLLAATLTAPPFLADVGAAIGPGLLAERGACWPHRPKPPAGAPFRELPPDVIGGFLAMRSDLIETDGPLDQRNFIDAEEREFCHRVRRAGYRVVQMGGLSVIHHQGVTTRSIPISRDVQLQQGQLVCVRLTPGETAARWKRRLESRFKRLRRSLKAIITPPGRTVQSID